MQSFEAQVNISETLIGKNLYTREGTGYSKDFEPTTGQQRQNSDLIDVSAEQYRGKRLIRTDNNKSKRFNFEPTDTNPLAHFLLTNVGMEVDGEPVKVSTSGPRFSRRESYRTDKGFQVSFYFLSLLALSTVY